MVVAERKGGLDLGEFKRKLPSKVSQCYYWHALKTCDAISGDGIPLCGTFLKLGFL